MTEPRRCDVAVIGAGIGGYVSAIRSSQLGKNVILIEKDQVGGTCLNRGCIPTKALLITAELLTKLRNSEEFGILSDNVKVDFEKVMARKEAIVKRLTDGIRFLIKKNMIQLVEGSGSLVSKNQILVTKSDDTKKIFEAENIILATGSEAPHPSFANINEETVLTTNGALGLKKIPETIVIVGGGIVGVEFAQVFNGLGSKVTVLEMEPDLLPCMDKEIGRTYRRILKKRGIEVHLNARVESVEVKPDRMVKITFTEKDSSIAVKAEIVLISGRRKPQSEGLGLEKVGVQIERGFVKVDKFMRTSIPNIYAVGDITGGSMLAHIAFTEGIVAAENIAGLESKMEYKAVPTCVYAHPEAASVGLSEDEAKEQGYKVSIGKFPLLGNGRALTFGETDGFAKVICDSETGEILGVHLVGPNVTDMIGEATLAIRLECTSEEIGDAIHAHPTISEALMEAARAVTKKAIQI